MTNQTTPTARDDLLDLVGQLSAALDNALLHQGKHMTEADRKSRRALVDHAEKTIHQYGG